MATYTLIFSPLSNPDAKELTERPLSFAGTVDVSYSWIETLAAPMRRPRLSPAQVISIPGG